MTPPAYGDGSIYPIGDGRWRGTLEAGLTDKGKRRRVSVSGKTEAEVKRKLKARRAEIAAAAGTVTSGAVLRRTVKSWVEEWLTIRVGDVRPATYAVDVAAMRYVLPTFGTKRIVDLTPRDIRNLHAKVRGDHGPATVARYHRATRKMLRDARQEGLAVPENVLTAAGPGEQENDREALETMQAVAVMHHATALPHGSRWFVAFHQGLRQGEALGLTWDHVDFVSNTITIAQQLQAVPYLDKRDRSKGFRVPHDYDAVHVVGRLHLVPLKTSKAHRVIPMVPEVRQVLHDLRTAQTEPNVGNLVWTRPDGQPIAKSDDTAEFQALQAAANVRHPSGRYFKGHEVRNTTATLLLEAGIDPVFITAILGHSNWATSVVYMKARAAKLLVAMEGIAAAFKPKEIG